MPRYMVERDFPGEFQVPTDERGVRACLNVTEVNRNEEVFWLHSYVSEDKKKTFCVYEAPSPEAIRRAANRNKLPLTRITEVRVLDPYFYL
jgi:hypothetical protein